MTNQPTIKKFGEEVVAVIPTSSPYAGKPNSLLPRWQEINARKITVDIAHLVNDGTSNLTVRISSFDDSNRTPHSKEVQWLIQHIWRGLTALRLVDGPTPVLD